MHMPDTIRPYVPQLQNIRSLFVKFCIRIKGHLPKSVLFSLISANAEREKAGNNRKTHIKSRKIETFFLKALAISGLVYYNVFTRSGAKVTRSETNSLKNNRERGDSDADGSVPALARQQKQDNNTCEAPRAARSGFHDHERRRQLP